MSNNATHTTNLYIMVVRDYKKMNTCSTSFAKKMKGHMSKYFSGKKIKQTWKGGALQVQNMGIVGGTRGR
jgi:hypothetical protein